jgi:hypothetical protein
VAFIDHLNSLKEEDAGVGILYLLVTEPDSLLCADVKNLLGIEQ